MNRHLLVLAAALCLSSACVSASPSGKALTESDGRGMEDCAFLGTIRGSSGWGGLFMGGVGVHNARSDALDEAAEKGATHYIWTDSLVSGTSHAGLRAYRCQ